MKKVFATITILASCVLIQAQSSDTSKYPYWIEMMQDEQVNFYETQKAFNTYWENRKVTKGSGYKPFKRWEWYMEAEINPDGSYPNIEKMTKSFESFNIKYNSSSKIQSGGNAIQSTNGAWTNLGPIALPTNGTGQPNGQGRINCIGLHPTDTGIILVGAPEGGIWRSQDHGKSWTSNTDTLVSMQISSIRFNPKNPNIVYAGTGDRDAGNRHQRGVIKSTNAGVSWSLSNSGMGNRIVGMLAIHPTKPDTILAATNAGIYRTLNAGASWSRVSTTNTHYKDIVFKPGNPQYAYATTNGDFYRSTNWGASWTKITSGLPTDGTRGVIAVTPDDANVVYFVLVKGSSYKGTYISLNSGSSFAVKSTTPNIMDWSYTGTGTGGQGWYDLDAASDPTDMEKLYVGGVNIFKSSDSGSTWLINAHWVGNSSTASVHADQHVLEWSADGKRLYSGNDGGINYTNNGGKTWINISSGLAISQIYKIGQAKFDEGLCQNGYQDNGSSLYDNGSWRTNRGGDGMECIIDGSDTRYVYNSVYYGNIARSTNGGRNFSRIAANGSNGINESGAWVTPYILDENSSGEMIIGYRNVWRSMNVKASSSNAVQWTKISNNLGGSNTQTIRVLEQSPANTDILYVMRSDRKLFRTDNLGGSVVTWVDLTSTLPANSMATDIEAHPTKPNVVYMTFNKKVYKSVNKGASWTNISGNLPNITLRCIVFDEQSSEGIYVGGTPGIYYKDSSMTNWISYYNGFPKDVSVTELEIAYDTVQPAFSQLRAATYGRGLWSSDLYDNGLQKPIANFNTKGILQGCSGEILELTDASAHVATSWNWVITPNTYTLLNGSQLNKKNLEIRIDSAGIYSIELRVSNSNGSDTLLKKDYLSYVKNIAPACTTTTTSSGSFGIGIKNVQFEQINNTTSGYDRISSWHDYTCGDIAYVKPNKSYLIKTTVGASNKEYVEVFIDFNNDNDFTDSGERVVNSPNAKGLHLDTINIPANAVVNKPLHMRVVSDFNKLSGAPCKVLGYGESEEYLVFIEVPTVNILATKDSVCAGDIVSYSAQTKGRIDTLSWDFGTSASPRYAIGHGPHKVQFHSSTGKKIISVNADNYIYSYDTLEVLPTPYPSFSIVKNPICENEKLELISSDTLSSSLLTYAWFKDSSILSNRKNNLTVLQAKQSDSGSYWYIASTVYCSDSSAMLKATIIETPKASFIPNDSGQCSRSNQFVLRNTSTGNQLNVANWTFGDGRSAMGDTATHSYAGAGIFTASMMVSNKLGCADTTVIQMQVFDHPKSRIRVVDTLFCEHNANGEFINNSFIVAGTQSAYWDFGDGSTSNLDSVNHTFTSLGKKTIMLVSISNEGCTDTSYTDITVYPKPDASFTTNAINGSTYTFIPTVKTHASYDWDFGDGKRSSLQTPTHAYNTNSAYQVELKVASLNACSDTSNAQIEIETIGISENLKSKVRIFPNPNNGQFTIQMNLENKVKLILLNEIGQIVWNKDVEAENMTKQNVENLAKGSYILLLQTGTETGTYKILVK